MAMLQQVEICIIFLPRTMRRSLLSKLLVGKYSDLMAGPDEGHPQGRMDEGSTEKTGQVMVILMRVYPLVI